MRRTPLLLATAAFVPTAVLASETTTYRYDVLGRLTDVAAAGGPASGVAVAYRYDAAGNRSNYAVSGVPATPTPSPSPSPTPSPTPTPTPTPPPPPTPNTGIVANFHFVQPALGFGAVQYGPAGASDWYVNASAGIQSNGSSWVFPNTVDGDAQSGFVKADSGGITLVVSNLTVGATYRVSFKLARPIGGDFDPVYVAALGNNMGVYSTQYGGWQQMTTGSFVATSSSGNLFFGGTNAMGSSGAGIDDVHVDPG